MHSKPCPEAGPLPLMPARQVEVLGQQAGLLQRQLAGMQARAGELEAAVAQQSCMQAAAKTTADELLARKTAAAKQLRQAERGQARLAQAAAAGQLQVAKLRVQLKAAEAASAGGGAGGGGKHLHKQLQRAEAEAGERR